MLPCMRVIEKRFYQRMVKLTLDEALLEDHLLQLPRVLTADVAAKTILMMRS